MRIRTVNYFIRKMEKGTNLKGPNNQIELQNYKIAEYIYDKSNGKKVA